MSKKKIITAAGVLALTAACCLFALTGCGNKLSTPSDFTFTFDMDKGTNAYSFKTVENGETYQVAVQKMIDDKTGSDLVSSNQASLITPSEGDPFYIWSELTGSKTGIKDKKAAGTIEGKVTFREYSSSASTVGGTIGINELPLGKYYVTCVAEATEDKEQSDPAWTTFTVGGTLKDPEFSYAVSGTKMTLTVGNSYLTNALGKYGLPASVDFTVDDGSGTAKTASVGGTSAGNWSYTNQVNGPNKSFVFEKNTVEIDVASAESYTVKAIAKGNGAEIKDSATVSVTDGTTGGNASTGGGSGGGPGGGPGGGGQGGGEMKITVADIPAFAAGAATITVPVAVAGSDIPLGGALAALPAEGSTYSYVLTGTGGMGEEITGILELKTDNTVTCTVEGFGPFDTVTKTGTYAVSENQITITFTAPA